MAQVPTAPEVLDAFTQGGDVGDEHTDLSAVKGSLFDGEQIDGVFRGGDTGARLVVATNRRLMLVESATWSGRTALTSVLYSHVSCVSFLTTPGERVAAATTVGIKVEDIRYELSCHNEEQARELHDLIAWQLISE